MATVPHPTAQPQLSLSRALEQAECLARQNLPQVMHERLSCAVALVKNGKVLQSADGHTWEVESASVPGKIYHLNGTGCPCEDAHYRAPQGRCKHVLATLLARKSLALMRAQEVQGQPESPAGTTQEDAATPEPVQGIPREHIVMIQGKPFVKVAGLLALAHSRGLQSLRTTFTYNDADMALAESTAVFPFGTFTDVGDACAANVNAKVKAHFRRVAATRAAARALRQALNISMVAVEELMEGE